MRKTIYSVVLLVLFLCPALFTMAGYCGDNQGENTECEEARYQIYATQNIMVLLDTKTGKVWKLSSDMSGKIKAEGVTVEGLAYASSDLDNFYNKLKDINFDNVSEKNKKPCRDEIIAEFSYGMDADKVNKILKYYKESTSR